MDKMGLSNVQNQMVEGSSEHTERPLTLSGL